MKKKIILLCLSLALVVGLALPECSYAWFAEGVGAGGSGTSHNFHTGKVGMSLTGDFKDELNSDGRAAIIPEDNLLDGTLTLTNYSTVDTQLRVKVTYNYLDSTVLTALAAAADDDPLSVTFDEPNDWTYSNGYWYYGGTSGTVTPRQGNQTDVINAISDIRFSGEYSEDKEADGSSSFAGNDITVTVTFEVKQADFVTWSQLGSIDFSTGLASS